MLISANLLLALAATATTTVADEGTGLAKIWGDDQCPNLGIQTFKNLQTCLIRCKYNPRCTAVNACPSGQKMRCIQRGCSIPVPSPTTSWGGCSGYNVKGQNEWKKVFSHDTRGGLFATVEEAKKKNVDDENALLYSILYNLEAYRTTQGYFHFKLCYPQLTQFLFPCNEWAQTSNPVLESKITDYNAIHITWNKDGIYRPFHGIGLSPKSKANNLIDDAPDHLNWWSSIGSIRDYPAGSLNIPGPLHNMVKKVELYVQYLPSTVSSSTPETCLPEEGVDWDGNNINLDKKETHEECKALCEDTAGCNFYVWKQNNDCWLKSKRGNTHKFSSNVVSGFPCRKCKPGSCKAPNVESQASTALEKAWGDDQCPNIAMKVSENLQICLKECKYNPRCTAVDVCSEGKNKRCIQRGCSLPVPSPTSSWRGCRGHVVKEDSEYNKMILKYVALNKNDEKSYWKGFKELLPKLLLHDDITSEVVGIAKIVTTQTRYPYALLEGEDVNLVRVPSKVLQINGTVNHYIGKRYYGQGIYRPTGLFAAPGEIVSVTIPEDLVGKIKVRIGHHRHRIDLGPLNKVKQKIASPFGGLIILVLHDRAATTRKGMFDVTVENAIEAPNFIFGKSTNDDWSIMKYLAAPWTILRIPGQISIYIETLKMKSVTNMTGVMANVKRSMDIFDELLGIPVGSQPGEEQLIYDPLRGGGYTLLHLIDGVVLCYGAGFMVADAALYTELINKNWNSPVAMHELGHRGNYPDFPDTCGEWSAELTKTYIEVKRGFRNWDDWATPWHVLKMMVAQKIFSKGKPCHEADGANKFPHGISYKPTVYQNCWTVLFRFPLSEFGWDTLRKVFNMNADKNKYRDIKYDSRKIKTDRLAELYCKATGHNMIPFFNFFNSNISESIATPCQKQPLPKKLTHYVNFADCIANKETPDLDCVKMPGFPDYKGLCLISGVCQTNPDQENKTTTFDNNIDIFGANRTRDTEAGCHFRAKEFFVRCGNDENHPITATYRLKNGRSTNATVPQLPLPSGNCYANPKVKKGRLTMPHNEGWSYKMVAAVCNKMCKAKNYSYFGVEWADQCWCGNKAPSPALKLEMTKCYRMCSGNSSLRCGGAYAVNAWKVCTGTNCNFTYE